MERFIDTYQGEEFDVIVVGGGISGASVAYDAASRGLKVALVEKNDFSNATSSATSKLIHGGVRYLANLEFDLVRESLRERRVLENIAPNFVYPMPMLMAHDNRSITNNKWVVRAGLVLYDLLGWDKSRVWDKSKKIPNFSMVSKKNTLAKEPGLRADMVSGASIFYDCSSIFPERFTLAFVKSAAAFGAKVANYTCVDDFIHEGGKVKGVKVTDLVNNKKHEIRATVTINCGGPWADIILGMAGPNGPESKLRRSEGIHIITKKRASDKYTVGCRTQDGKHFFLIPWRGHTLIGTTDKEYIGDPDKFKVTRQSIEELIKDVNATFGDGTLCFDDVLHTYGGLRPLVEKQTEGTYSSSRKYEIYDNAKDGLDGLITVEGGKYTTSRNLAETCMKMVWNKLDKKAMSQSITEYRYLAGSEIRDMEGFIVDIKRDNTDFSSETMEYLGRHYGTEYAKIVEIARKDKKLTEVVSCDGEILAEVAYVCREEIPQNLADILVRRTGIGTLGNPGDEILTKVAKVAAKELGWDKARTEAELQSARSLLTLPVE